MKHPFYLLLSILLIGLAGCTPYHSETPKGDIQSVMQEMLPAFQDCDMSATDSKINCRQYLAKAVEKAFDIKDFSIENKDVAITHMTPIEMGELIMDGGKWKSLGTADQQEVLEKAQQVADEKKLVVAIRVREEHIDHISVIIPGELFSSNSWKLKVPNSASFFLHNPSKSYVGKGLSYSYSSPKGVTLWTRK